MAKIAIYGAGAVGAYLGALLWKSGANVSLIARGRHLEAMRKDGVRVVGLEPEALARPFCTDDPSDVGPCDYVIIALKAHSVTGIVDRIGALFHDETAVVTAQNGVPWWYFYRSGCPREDTPLQSVDPGGRIWAGIGPRRVIGCVLYVATEVARPGVVRHISGSRFAFGEPGGEKTARTRRLARLVIGAGLRAPIRSIRREIWHKLLGNLSFNPISALTTAPLNEIVEDADTAALAVAMMEEARRIAGALGTPLAISTEQRMRGARSVGSHRTSMLQDLEGGRAMEIDATLGAVRELGRMTGVQTPMIDAVLALLRQRASQAGLYRPI